jgi:hypothetical protein
MKMLLAIGGLYAILMATGFWSMWPTPDDGCFPGDGYRWRAAETADPRVVEFKICE